MSFAIGNKGERLLMEYFQANGWEILEQSEGYFPDWDIRAKSLKGAEITFEVKYDAQAYYWSSNTRDPGNPNLYIEYRNTNKESDSGILTSKANVYAYILKSPVGESNELYLFDRKRLAERLVAGKWVSTGNEKFGDNNAQGWLLPLKDALHREMGFLLKKTF